jgi:hypothetical protein
MIYAEGLFYISVYEIGASAEPAFPMMHYVDKNAICTSRAASRLNRTGA